jgi:putative oxidoreductase
VGSSMFAGVRPLGSWETLFENSCIWLPILLVHGANGSFMNWYGNQKGEGFEYHLLTLDLAFAVILAGAGKWSID